MPLQEKNDVFGLGRLQLEVRVCHFNSQLPVCPRTDSYGFGFCWRTRARPGSLLPDPYIAAGRWLLLCCFPVLQSKIAAKTTETRRLLDTEVEQTKEVLQQKQV